MSVRRRQSSVVMRQKLPAEVGKSARRLEFSASTAEKRWRRVAKNRSNMDIFNYHPRASHEVQIGNRPLGGDAPLRIQSMTTASTNDTEACVEQCKRIMDAGGDYVRLTTQGTIEAENLRNIKAALREAGYDRPLVADVHFNPNVADVAAGGIVEKVRINPGNYVDPARQFKHLEYTDEE